MAAKVGLGPLKELGLAPRGAVESQGRSPSRSRSPKSVAASSSFVTEPLPALPGPNATASSSSFPSNGLHLLRLAPAQNLRGASRSSSKPSSKAKNDDDEDVDSFLAGGRAMAAAAAQAQQAARAKTHIVEVSATSRSRTLQEAEDYDRRRLDAEKQLRESERLRAEEQRQREENEKRKEERRKIRQEEKKRRREQKARERVNLRGSAELSEDEEDLEGQDDSSAEEQRCRPEQRGGFKEVFRGDGAKRVHWGESVKGRVSNDYKGFSDADLDRRFNLQTQQQQSGEKLMTEAEVLAMMRKGRTSR